MLSYASSPTHIPAPFLFIQRPQVCYSWWVLSALSMVGKLHWIDADKLSRFILSAQVSLFKQCLPLQFHLSFLTHAWPLSLLWSLDRIQTMVESQIDQTM